MSVDAGTSGAAEVGLEEEGRAGGGFERSWRGTDVFERLVVEDKHLVGVQAFLLDAGGSEVDEVAFSDRDATPGASHLSRIRVHTSRKGIEKNYPSQSIEKPTQLANDIRGMHWILALDQTLRIPGVCLVRNHRLFIRPDQRMVSTHPDGLFFENWTRIDKEMSNIKIWDAHAAGGVFVYPRLV